MRDLYHNQPQHDIYVVKLVNGSTLVSECIAEDDNGEMFKLTNPMELIRSLPNEDTVSVSMFPWLFGCDDQVTSISSMDIMAVCPAGESARDTYVESLKKHLNITDINQGNKPGLDNLDLPPRYRKNRNGLN